ncbi:hypothetical protein ABMA27_006454 [Loxostege sticticalis]|uniref:THAP-type domain-containing protein n=1 Tax=Loxostege sticticalis TaxID=481309 RepID=A0ABR3IJ71_LOXSC
MVGDPFFDHIDHNYYKCHRSCAVPLCKSTTENTPEKLFVQVPSATSTRDEWLRLAGCGLHLTGGNYYFCEDHFDIKNEMTNYMEYKIMGHVQRVRLKMGCLPSKFECQQNHKTVPLHNEKSDMFKINVVQGKNLFTIETVPENEWKKANVEATKAVIKSEDIVNDSKKKTYTKSTIKVKKMDDIKDTLKRKPIIISPNLKKVKIIKKI